MDTNTINSIFQEFRKQIAELKQENKELNERLDRLEKNLIKTLGYGSIKR